MVRPQQRIEECQDIDHIKSPWDSKPLDNVPVPEVSAKTEMIKKRKFSFRHGKMSITEESSGDPGNIYLEVEGREIEVREDCLVSNSQHFTRVLEDISTKRSFQY